MLDLLDGIYNTLEVNPGTGRETLSTYSYVALKIDRINTDAIGSRIKFNPQKADYYAQQMQEGDEFPPVTVFDDGSHYWLADGFHRFFAAREIGEMDIKVRLREGTKQDAIQHYEKMHVNR